jgi:hypothetical protein
MFSEVRCALSRECSYLSAKEAGQQDSEDGVQHSRASKTSNGLLPNGNVDIAIRLYREEVAVDTEDDRSAAELERIKRCRAKLQSSTAETHCRDAKIRRRERDVLGWER